MQFEHCRSPSIDVVFISAHWFQSLVNRDETLLLKYGESVFGCCILNIFAPMSDSAQFIRLMSLVMNLLHSCFSVLTSQSTDVGADVPQAVTTDYLLESLPHLLTPEGINERVDHCVAHDEDEIHVEVGHEAHAVEVTWAGDHEDQVKEKRSPADDEDSQEDSECDGTLHAGALVDGVVSGQGSDTLDV